MGSKKFGKSDAIFKLLGKQGSYLSECAQLLTDMVPADLEARTEINTRLHATENAADEASHKLMKKINQTFVLPYDRDDLYRLSSKLDDCIDYMDEAGDNTVLYKLGSLPEGAAKQIEILVECAEMTAKIVEKLNKIDDNTRAYWIAINDLENKADKIYRKMLGELFTSDHDPLEVMKMKLVIDALERAVDSFEELANVIETIAIKES